MRVAIHPGLSHDGPMQPRRQAKISRTPPFRATIYDVAAHAGVSIATVSRFLKGIEPIAADTKRRVEASIAKLQYRPSALAASLASRFKQSIGFVISQGSRAYSSLFLSEILSGIAGAAAREGWSVHITMLDKEGSHRPLLDRHADLVDGSLILDEALDDPGVQALVKKGHRVVLMNHRRQGLPSVGIDNAGGARLAVKHLVGLGHRRIACLGGPSPIARERINGFTAALRRSGIKPTVVSDSGFERASAAETARRLLSSKHRPTGILVVSDWMAVGVLEAAASLGIDVPSQLSVVGFDDAIIAEVTSPALTTVHQPLETMGESAFKLFQNLLPRSSAAVAPLLLPTTLVVRKSTAKAC